MKDTVRLTVIVAAAAVLAVGGLWVWAGSPSTADMRMATLALSLKAPPENCFTGAEASKLFKDMGGIWKPGQQTQTLLLPSSHLRIEAFRDARGRETAIVLNEPTR
jgi:hypothetical protein